MESENVMGEELLTCPFCKDKDFDEIGLKHHLLSGGCGRFNAVETLREERERLERETK